MAKDLRARSFRQPDSNFLCSVPVLAGATLWKGMNDHELLQQYAKGSEGAFTELVGRYIDFVYSAALRQVGADAHLAQDVAQSVFVDLARKARSLPPNTVLTGWLYTGTRYAAAKIVRTEQRRRAREQESWLMQESSLDPAQEPLWDELRPVLDHAMHELNERDRNAVLLRYFEGRPLAHVGATLGLTEDAARMRIGRALDKLRDLLATRGVKSTSTALAVLLAQQTISAAPAGLAGQIAGTVLSTAGVAAGSTILNLIAMSKLKIAVATTLVVAGVATPFVIQQHTQQKLRGENQSLRQQVEQLAAQVADQSRTADATQRDTSTATTTNDPSSELLKLRGEVARLRQDSRELARIKAAGARIAPDATLESTLEGVAARVTQLKELLQRMPDKSIPELQFLSTKDWLQAAASVKQLDTEEDFRDALSSLRSRAKGQFGRMMQKALKQFVDANAGTVPTDIAQLAPYLDPQMDASLLQRYRLTQSGTLSSMLIAELAPAVDDEYDTRYEFRGLNSSSSQTVNKVDDALKAASLAYAQANNGLLPKDPVQIAPYLERPLDPARVEKFLAQRPANVTTLDQLKAAHAP